MINLTLQSYGKFRLSLKQCRDEVDLAIQQLDSPEQAEFIRGHAQLCEKIAQAKGDNEAAVWFREFQLKAVIFLGKWSRELEKAQGARTELVPNDGKKSKAELLSEVGLSTSTAQRYEELVGLTGP